MLKNYSHLKNFTLPPVLAVATNMRYGRHRSSGLLLLFQECNALPPPELTLWSWLKIISSWRMLSQLQNLWHFSFTKKQIQNTWISGWIEFPTGRWPITEQNTLKWMSAHARDSVTFSSTEAIFVHFPGLLKDNFQFGKKNSTAAYIYECWDFPRICTIVLKFTGLFTDKRTKKSPYHTAGQHWQWNSLKFQ